MTQIIVFGLLVYSVTQTITGTEVLVCDSQDASLEVSCDDSSKVLVFEWAEYGRTDENTCNQDDDNRDTNTDCRMHTALGLLQEKCYKMSSCKVDIKRTFRPDPCFGTKKYLKAKYQCVPASSLISICKSGTITDKTSGYLVSPNYPNMYNPGEKCRTEISHGNKKIHLELLDLEVEARTTVGCYDWLRIMQKDSPAEMFSYCGIMDSIQEPTQLSFTQAVVEFLPDDMNQYRGFLIKFRVDGYNLENNSEESSDEKLAVENILKLQESLKKLREVKKQKKLKAEREKRKKAVKAYKKPDQVHEKEHQQQPTMECTEKSIPVPLHGSVLLYKKSSSVTLGCQEGYQLENLEYGHLMCERGQWVGDPGKCIEIGCSVPESPDNGELIYRKRSYISDIEYICHKDFVLIGDRIRSCQADGQWSGLEPYCVEGGLTELSLFGEVIIVCLLTCAFLYLKKRCWPFKLCTSKNMFSMLCNRRYRGVVARLYNTALR